MEEENEQYYELSTDGWIVKHRPTLNTNVLNEQGRFDPVKAMFDTSDDITYFIACPRIVDVEFSDVNKFKKWPLSFYLRYIVQTESLPTCDLGMYLSRIEDFGEPHYVLDLFEESELEKNPILKEQFEDVLFLKNRIGYDPEEQETEQKEELPQPEPEQLNDEKVHRYFTTNYKKQQAEQYFTILVKDGYFHSNSKLQDFLYYCGVDNSVPPSAKLIWMETQTLLAYFIHEKLGKNNRNDLWKITKEVFVLKDGKQPNTDSMKHDFSKRISNKSESEWKKLAEKL